MRAAQFTEYGKPFEITDVPDPAPEPGGVVVRVDASGICRSDWHLWQHDWTWLGMEPELPTILGHEVGGTVVALGDGVTRLAEGDRVTIPFTQADGTCPFCVQGRPNLCDDVSIPGIQKPDGGYAEFQAVAHADYNCIKLPDGVDARTAAMLGCRFMTGWGAVRRGRVAGGEWVAIHGLGGVGMSAVQAAAAFGALVVAVDVESDKLATATEQGAVHTVDARGLDDVGAAVKDLTGGGAHVSIDALGRAFTLQNSLASLRKGGRHVQAGLTTQAEQGQVPIPVDALVNFEWEIIGSIGNPHPHYPELLAAVANGVVRPERLLEREVALPEINDVLSRMTDFDTHGFNIITSWDGGKPS